jgi:hypothetical protein
MITLIIIIHRSLVKGYYGVIMTPHQIVCSVDKVNDGFFLVATRHVRKVAKVHSMIETYLLAWINRLLAHHSKRRQTAIAPSCCRTITMPAIAILIRLAILAR